MATIRTWIRNDDRVTQDAIKGSELDRVLTKHPMYRLLKEWESDEPRSDRTTSAEIEELRKVILKVDGRLTEDVDTISKKLDEVAKKQQETGTGSGSPGHTPQINVGTTRTIAAGQNANVTRSLDGAGNATFSFDIPRGDKGENGEPPTLIMGRVTQIPATAAPSASLTETSQGSNEYRLDLNIPRGEQGEDAVAALNPRGDWSASTAYAKNDYVTASNGNTYVLYADTSTGQDPTTTSGVWQLIALRGAKGEPGVAGADGAKGTDGKDGKDGVSPALKMGTATSIEADEAPRATLAKTADNEYTLDLWIPKASVNVDIDGLTEIDWDGLVARVAALEAKAGA